MRPDVEKYLAMMEDWNMPREQKVQFIHDLWRIMESFVDRAFGIHPVQQVTNKTLQPDLQDSAKHLDSSYQHNDPPEEGVRHET